MSRGDSLMWVTGGVERYGVRHGPAQRIRRGLWTGAQITLIVTFAVSDTLRGSSAALSIISAPAGLTGLLALWRWWSARAAATNAQRSPRPWESDRPWHRAGTPPREPLFLRSVIAAVAYGFVGWRAVGRTVAPGSGAFAALAAFGAAGAGIISTRRTASEPRVELLFDEFPLRTGSRVRIHLATPADGPSLTKLCTALRAIRSPRSDRMSHPAPPVVVAVVEPSVEPDGTGPEEFVTVQFDIPADAPGTRLAPGDETHWELVVLGDTVNGAFTESVIVPIYGPDGGGVEAGA